MAIYKAIKKDLGTGSITGDSYQTYVVPYQVFTDNNTTPYSIYEQARSSVGIPIYAVDGKVTKEKLPVYGTVDANTHVSDINIERASENNIVAVPKLGLGVNAGRHTSWTCWNYTVTFTSSDTTTVTTGDSGAPWNSDTALSCSFSPKTYERYDNKTLVPNSGNKDNVPIYPLYEEEYENLQNTVGDDLYRTRTVYNYVLNFSYAVRKFDAEWLVLYMNTMNLKDCVICGIPLKKYHAVINEMRVEQAEWNGKIYYNVNVEVEIQYQQRLTYDEYVSSGHRAYMIEGSTVAINNHLNSIGVRKEKSGFVFKYTNASTAKKYPVPIEELTDIRQRDNVPDNRWFMKKKNLGYFEGYSNKIENTEIVPKLKRIFLVEGALGDDVITVSYSRIDSSSSSTDDSEDSEDSSSTEVSGGTSSSISQEVLYYTGIYNDGEYIYNTLAYTPTDEAIQKKDSNLRFISTRTATFNDTTETLYYSTQYVISYRMQRVPSDPFEGQYDTIQTPIALNKYGGIYFAKNETSSVDDVTQPGAIDMNDSMLGKVKDYQHVARDWTALGFPKKGMFWANTSNTNSVVVKRTSSLFK